MTDKPERIWAIEGYADAGRGAWDSAEMGDDTEYVLKSTHDTVTGSLNSMVVSRDEEIDALRDQLATARSDALRAAADRNVLERLLRGYRLMRTHDEDGAGYPLIDALTCGHTTVKEGEEECYFLADHICGHILALIDKETDT